MTASELRIGNLIFDDYREIVVDVHINILRSIINNNPCFYKPIPLTEEWLLKLGFQEHPNDYYYFGGYKIRFDLDNDLNPIKFCFLFFDIGDWEMEIKYVHQLQNLYFALTGEELKQQEQ